MVKQFLTYVPEFDGDGALGDLPHVEPDCGDHVLVEGPAGNHVHKCGLAGMLQAHQGQLHLLLNKIKKYSVLKIEIGWYQYLPTVQ